MGLTDRLLSGLIDKSLKSASNNSDNGLLIKTIKQLAPTRYKEFVDSLDVFLSPNSPFQPIISKLYDRLNENARKKFINNFIINHNINGFVPQYEKENQEGEIPAIYSVLISPSFACNLKCRGCYAQDYPRKNGLDYKTLDSVVSQADKLGIRFFTILGGEPFIRGDIFDLFQKHNRLYFQTFTNGTLIDDKKADRLASLGNIWVNFSLEGFEKETDERRGEGTYKKIISGMSKLKERGVGFGYSTTVTKRNLDIITSDEFVDSMIEKGSLIGWYFLYMPVANSDLELMPSPEERLKLKKRGEHIRKNKPLFIVDFWNDAPYVEGCIAGKRYIHINANGDVEPCIFMHFATDNIQKKPLKEILNFSKKSVCFSGQMNCV